MKLEELLLKELEYARDQYQNFASTQDRAVNLFGALIIGLVTFIVRGDLPKKAYLIVAFVLLLSLIYISYINYKKRCSAGVYRISELKISNFVKQKHIDHNIFDLIPRRKYLQKEPSSKFDILRFPRYILLSFIFIVYVFFVHSGLKAYNLSNLLYMIFLCTAILLLAFLLLLCWIQNEQQKKRFSILLNSKNFEVPNEDKK